MDLSQKILEALQQVRSHNFVPLFNLISDPATAVQLLPYLKQYVSDPNPDVRLAVEIVANNQQSPEATSILASLLTDKQQAGEKAAAALFNRDCSQLRLDRGHQLEDQLIKRLQQGSDDPSTLILLTCFPRKTKTVQLLEELRKKQSRQTKISHEVMGDLNVVTDVTLSHFGDAAASSNIKQQLKDGSVGNIVLILDSLRAINDKLILADVVELLRNKQNAERFSTYPNNNPDYLRICDVALSSLAKKLDPGFKAVQDEHGHFSDTQLTQAYSRFSGLVKPL